MSIRTPPEWYVISLRPSGEHAALRRAAARRGAGLVALSPWRLEQLDDDATRDALAAALAASHVVFTSPGAVRAAASLLPLRAGARQQWFAVGAGSASALRRAGVAGVVAPARMDTEGLLGLPGLQVGTGDSVGLVTAPGGRGELAPALQARGALVLRADVYARVPVAPSPKALASLRALGALAPRARLALALSSGEALQRLMATVPDDVAAILRRATVVAASARLASLAHGLGCAHVQLATGPRPAMLVSAAARALATRPT
ncbi:uroporphyrinogen-III synthase [Montanilutibacter psychrotolerans]|uniref:Uroporphyrinogen-III synthase n=1 Tax=Montanilutibacter psychrotolerans TaxID=1327343 RepID=A0A3M8SRE9_9GAMM|nr:uroporphyrinogen-III synthase [Lysobacter psychrotolerans]RNF83897.1 uroporphyrinogen-III synthase [Lysobacter psychrotolerans]